LVYEDDIREAAHRAERGIERAIDELRQRLVRREDDFTGVLKGNLDAELKGKIGGLTWECAILDHSSGQSAAEKEFGADLLIHVRFNTPELQYDKGLLVQSKRLEWGDYLSPSEHQRLARQCRDMLLHTAAAFVFVYSSYGMRAGSATAVAGSQNRYLNEQSPWTSYRFFLELFRCPIGDPYIVTPYPEDLRPRAIARILASAPGVDRVEWGEPMPPFRPPSRRRPRAANRRAPTRR
jgi:hypothetical protein